MDSSTDRFTFFFNWLVNSSTHWIIQVLIHWIIGSMMHRFVDSLVHRLTSSRIIDAVNWCIDWLCHWFIDSSFVQYSFFHCFADSLTHRLTIDSLSHRCIAWCIVSLNPWFIGPSPVPWFIDSLDHRFINSLIHWLIGSWFIRSILHGFALSFHSHLNHLFIRWCTSHPEPITASAPKKIL
jgi:hypothetical protein